jgi:hypothetical protein
MSEQFPVVSMHPHVATCVEAECARCDGPEGLSYLVPAAIPEPLEQPWETTLSDGDGDLG